MQKTDLKSLSLEELTTFVKDIGEPPFRAKQIYKWLFKGVASFQEMTDLSEKLRSRLEEAAYINKLEILRKQISEEDGTIKYLFGLTDGESVESVVMRYHHGNTICVSTEVGCRMGCAFCASGIGGLIRRLRPSEMIDQILFAQKDSELDIQNVVLMGIGEPLDNFDNVIKFLYTINHPDALNIGMRHISLSTCGLVPEIEKLAKLRLGLTLSVSLHASNSITRSSIMPVNKRYDLPELMSACRRYFEETGRRISFEYALIEGKNDSIEDAKELAALLKGFPAHLNIIPVNSVEERSFKKPDERYIQKFVNDLSARGVNVTVRRKLGSDIDASCGQLRRKQQRESRQI